MPVITGVWPPRMPRRMNWITTPKRLSGNRRVSGRTCASMVSLSLPIGNLARIVSSVRVIVALLLVIMVVVANSLYHICAERSPFPSRAFRGQPLPLSDKTGRITAERAFGLAWPSVQGTAFPQEAADGSALTLPERACLPSLRAIEADLIATAIQTDPPVWAERQVAPGFQQAEGQVPGRAPTLGEGLAYKAAFFHQLREDRKSVV